MKIEYNNLYTHFVFTTLKRKPLILDQFRIRIEKYITGIANNNGCKLYSIYANPKHVHFLVSRSPRLDEESLSTIIADSSENLSMTIVYVSFFFNGSNHALHFQYLNIVFMIYVSILKIKNNIIKNRVLRKNTKNISNSINKQYVKMLKTNEVMR